MYGFEKAKYALEFDKIIEFIAGNCVSDSGRARLLNSSPVADAENLRLVLMQIQDMRDVFTVEGGYPIWDFCDVRLLLNKIEPTESYLETADFMKIQNFLELIEEGISFRNKLSGKYPYLKQILVRLMAHPGLLSQLRSTFEPSGKIFDNASPELKSIRFEMSKVDADIHIRLDRIVRNKKEHIQEEYLTLRDGRLVVPVREFSVTKIPGIVHGQSSSGATYFVEPMPVVELNNQMQKLRSAEKKEIIKILKRLTNLVRQDADQLLNNYYILNELDSLQAKARYANEYACSRPEINGQFAWHLKNACHPLLLKVHRDSTVPLNLEIGHSFNELIISGPNAGGKTVALKTVGLLQLLFQCGFHVPVAEGSRFPLCRQIFTVIGDEQSIENDLSTFSSHIQSLKSILDHVREYSLVLIDEIGSGTEPMGGAALSVALMEELNRDKVVSVITTHQNQLKAYAAEHEGIENAAMQFDMDKLSPLFTLETGIPGSSYTFEICRRLGLDEQLIKRALAVAGQDAFQLDSLITEVTHKSQEYSQKLSQLSIKESEVNGLLDLYKIRNEELKKKQRKFDKEARERANQLLENVNKNIEAAIREIRESHADRQVVKRARRKIDDLKAGLAGPEAEKLPSKLADISSFQVGQRVRSLQYGISGVVNKVFPGKNEIEIDREGLKITVPVTRVEKLDDHGKVIADSSRSSAPAEAQSGGVNVSNEIDLRGLMADEAIREVQSYLDMAVLSSWAEVRIVHGKGTGALRKAIHQYLRTQPAIKGFRLGKWGEGDSGVTVVQLK